MNRWTVRARRAAYWVRMLAAGILWGVAVLALCALLLICMAIADSAWPGLLAAVMVIAVCLALLVAPRHDEDDAGGPVLPVWDTVDGVPVSPGSHNAPHRWDPEVSMFRRWFDTPTVADALDRRCEHEPPDAPRLRPAVPPDGEGGCDG